MASAEGTSHVVGTGRGYSLRTFSNLEATKRYFPTCHEICL